MCSNRLFSKTVGSLAWSFPTTARTTSSPPSQGALVAHLDRHLPGLLHVRREDPPDFRPRIRREGVDELVGELGGGLRRLDDPRRHLDRDQRDLVLVAVLVAPRS